MLSAVSKRRLAASAASFALTAGALVVAPAAQAAPADTAPTITGVRLSDEFGGLNPYIPTGCFLVISFTDTTPSGNDGYRVTATTPDGGATEMTPYAYAPESTRTQLSSSVPCPTVVDGAIFDIDVTEIAGGAEPLSEPFVYQLAVTGHPDGVRLQTDRTGGSQTEFVAGDAVTFSFDGDWEPGTRFSTQVWTSKTVNFDGEDYNDNRQGGAAITEVDDSPDLPTGFSIPARAQGRWVWISVLGEKEGKVRWLYTFSPIRVSDAPETGPKTQPSSWVKNFGSVSKNPRVGKVSEVTSGPELSKAGRAANLKVRYQWVIGKKSIIKGTTAKKYRVPAKYQGKVLSVVVALTKAGYTPRYKKLRVGLIRGR